jgi:hypothetical protein
MHLDATQKSLVSGETLIDLLFTEADRPSPRTFAEWRAKRLIPYVKIGRLVYFDVAAVRAALANLTVNARA